MTCTQSNPRNADLSGRPHDLFHFSMPLHKAKRVVSPKDQYHAEVEFPNIYTSLPTSSDVALSSGFISLGSTARIGKAAALHMQNAVCVHRTKHVSPAAVLYFAICIRARFACV